MTGFGSSGATGQPLKQQQPRPSRSAAGGAPDELQKAKADHAQSSGPLHIILSRRSAKARTAALLLPSSVPGSPRSEPAAEAAKRPRRATREAARFEVRLAARNCVERWPPSRREARVTAEASEAAETNEAKRAAVEASKVARAAEDAALAAAEKRKKRPRRAASEAITSAPAPLPPTRPASPVDLGPDAPSAAFDVNSAAAASWATFSEPTWATTWTKPAETEVKPAASLKPGVAPVGIPAFAWEKFDFEPAAEDEAEGGSGQENHAAGRGSRQPAPVLDLFAD